MRRFERALKYGGRLFVIVGTGPAMEARLVRRLGPSEFSAKVLFETCVEPLENVPTPAIVPFLTVAAVTQIDPAGLKAKMDSRQEFCLLDVREPWEVARASLPGSVCIPLQEIPSRMQELDAGAEIIVMCQAGMRSQRAAEFLAGTGVSAAWCNLRGGIAAWARQFDPGLDLE